MTVPPPDLLRPGGTSVRTVLAAGMDAAGMEREGEHPDLGLPRAGFDVSRAIKGARGNNADALYALLNREINTFAGQGKKSRERWTLDQLQAAYNSLDEIGDQVADTIKTAIED